MRHLAIEMEILRQPKLIIKPVVAATTTIKPVPYLKVKFKHLCLKIMLKILQQGEGLQENDVEKPPPRLRIFGSQSYQTAKPVVGVRLYHGGRSQTVTTG
uniref:Uncharacterized protein n=1 Tax=Cacopsylla melanoneura TaxID=428564 RepID=A0A8D8S7X7_9HEMI